jgi:5-formaminoimidazole-4-carboxamide-1-(beta)-D-ribofuranosyl 5'-monophosphate synthetase
MMETKIKEVIRSYDPKKIRIGVLGSHSALEIASGAKQEAFETVVVCQKGREKTYTKYYHTLFDHTLILDKFADMTHPSNVKKLNALNTIFVPNRSFSVYAGYENIEEKFTVPLIGNRYLLRTEERNTPRNQQYLLQKADIFTPKIFNSPSEIDRLIIAKVPEKERVIERAFFYASSPEEFEKIAAERIKQGIITEEALEESIIEEYIIGAKFNANLFWSPLTDNIDLLGFDRRVQTDLDGVLDLPAREQLEKIFTAAEQFVHICKKEYPPGMIGLFALQGAITKDLKFYVFDVSPRVPGCPCVEPTSPYMKYKYGFEVGPGRRVAMEIKCAVKEGRLAEVVT